MHQNDREKQRIASAIISMLETHRFEWFQRADFAPERAQRDASEPRDAQHFSYQRREKKKPWKPQQQCLKKGSGGGLPRRDVFSREKRLALAYAGCEFGGPGNLRVNLAGTR